MEDQLNIITVAILIGATIGFIIGYKLYSWFGWNPEDPTDTALDFIMLSKCGCGLMGLFSGAAAGLAVIVYILN